MLIQKIRTADNSCVPDHIKFNNGDTNERKQEIQKHYR